jgi:chaperonin GroES
MAKPLVSFQPLGPRCLVRPVEKDKVSEIIIAPEASTGKSDEAIIIALGTEPFGYGKVKDPNAGQIVQLKVGDKVLFSQYTGSFFTLGGIECRVLAYDDLLGLIHDNKPVKFQQEPTVKVELRELTKPTTQSAKSELYDDPPTLITLP